MRRRLLLIILALCAGAIVLVAALPFWLGAVAGFIGRSRGLTFAQYERIGYSRFALRDAEFRLGTVHVTVARAEADTPVVWLWRRWTKNNHAIVASNWRVDIGASTSPGNPNTPRGWLPLRAQLQRIAVQLDRWLPIAHVGAGVVRWPGDEIAVTSAKWAGRELATTGFTYRALKADATLAFAPDDLMRITASTGDGAARTKLESRGARVGGEFVLWEQSATIEASFAPQGWLPGDAALQAKAWTIAGDRLKLGELYRAVRGSVGIEWHAGRFAADVTAASDPLPDKVVPPLELAVRGNGDLQAFTIESLNAILPGMGARLSEPVTIERTGKIRESAASFAVQADLSKIPWLSATGMVTGEARVVSRPAASPAVEFRLEAKDVAGRDMAVSAASAQGRLDWPRLQIAEGVIVGGEGERLAWHGGWDFNAKEILEASVAGQVRRRSLVRWLPSQPEFDVVTIDARASGALTTLRHEGKAEADGVKVRGVKPLAVAVEWHGQGTAVAEFKARLTAGESKVSLTGTADTLGLTVNTLDFVQGEAPRLRLIEPATMKWRPQMQLESLRLAGPEGALAGEMTLGESGHIKLSANRIVSSWFDDFVALPGPASTLTLLALVGSWEQRGPMTFSLTGGASVDLGEGRIAAVNVAARGDGDGLRIEALRAAEADETVINATGRLPLTLTPGASSPLHMEEKGELILDATVAPHSAFWQKLATMSGVELREPKATAHLGGTWQKPEGRVSLQAERIAIDPKRVTRPLPALEALDVEVSGDREGVTLTKFSVKVEGQAVRAEGRLPIPDGQWGTLIKEPLVAAQRDADLRLEIPDAEVAVFTRFLPAALAAKGRLQADVRYTRGGLEGNMALRDAASRPLGPLGVLQEINADVTMSGRKFTLRSVTARSGGQPVTLSGTVELPEKGEPRFDLALRGENLPFVRQTGLLVRGDLDLKLQTATGAPPKLGGSVRLRDSLFLSDVRAFLPKGGGAGPARRPPYFSIETPPINTWTLAIDVVGERFLRVRTPVFVGVASARFRLGGTLGEPRAIGESTIDEGTVRMPFASFSVTQGSVRLTEADPYEPAVYLRGTSRRYGYDLTMEINGRAAQPAVVFTSSPALDSEQVLLMVMTGSAPSNEIAKSATQRVANVGYFLGQSLLGNMGSDAADADRLKVASGEKISRQGKETYEIEYRLSDRWAITGEYSEFDEYNAGVKWKIFRAKRTEETGDETKK